MLLRHELTGSGPPVVLLHPGIADSRIWDPQWESFAGRYRLVRCDLRGFGESPFDGPAVCYARDVVELLDGLGVAAASFVGTSLGGRIALEIAVARPDLVRALVLVGASVPGLVPGSDELAAYGAAEDEAVGRGDLDAATELNLRMWVDGPRRSASDVDPLVREAVRRMQRRALELQAPVWETVEPEPLVAELAERLGEVAVPTLVAVGEEDVEYMQRMADAIAAAIPGAQQATLADTAHVPNLEVPAAFDELVLDFLGGTI